MKKPASHAVTVLALTALMALPAAAAENGLTNYPVGAAGTNIGGFPPIPGLFLLQQFSYTSARGLYGDDGKKLPVPFSSDAYVSTTRILASYPVTLPGNGHLYSQLVLPVVRLDTSFFGQDATTTGLTNVTVSPFIGRWALSDNLSLSTGVDIATNTGAYSKTKFSVATNYTSVIPVVALRYENPAGLDLGIGNRLLFNTRNDATHYKSGTLYAFDFQAGWNIGPWKIGAVGGYFNQITDDTTPLFKPLNGNRSEYLAVGPSVTWETRLFGRPVNINLNYQIGALARNTTKSSTGWLNIAIPLWVPGGPPPKPVI